MITHTNIPKSYLVLLIAFLSLSFIYIGTIIKEKANDIEDSLAREVEHYYVKITSVPNDNAVMLMAQKIFERQEVEALRVWRGENAEKDFEYTRTKKNSLSYFRSENINGYSVQIALSKDTTKPMGKAGLFLMLSLYSFIFGAFSLIGIGIVFISKRDENVVETDLTDKSVSPIPLEVEGFQEEQKKIYPPLKLVK